MTHASPQIGTTLAGRYRLQRVLGAGGMATVYLAEDLKHQRRVAIKVLRPELTLTLGVARFQSEIRIAAQLQHPHVLTVHDSGEADGVLHYVMPYVEGESLRERLVREGPLPVFEVVRLLAQVADALAHAHARGVVHRDIKPENVLLSGRHAMVMDFGIAKALSDAGQDSGGATSGVALGTPAYMAPEQAAADASLDHRADVYSLGVLGYELLSGRPPFEGTPQQVLVAHLSQAPVPVERLRPDTPPALARVIQRALAKSPAERWQRAEDFREALEPLAHPSGETAQATLVMPAEAVPPRKPRIPAGLWLVAAALVLAVGAWALWPQAPSPTETTQAAPAAAATAKPADGIPDLATDPSIAVLPFLDLSQAGDQAYFSEGIAEELLNLLSRVRNLRVAARTSSFSFKNQQADIATIARRLHVAAVLEGSVRKSGDTVRISVKLVRASDGTPLWSETYDRQLDDIFKVQDEIAAAVVTGLKAHLLPPPFTTHATSPEAYAAYLRAREIARQGAIPALRQALDLFRQATALDPNYAPAWVGVANTLCYLVAFRELVPAEGLPLAKQALGRAIAADPGYAPAYAILGWWHAIGDRDLQAAASNVERALALDPNDADSLNMANFLGRRIQRLETAIAIGEALRERDPINADNAYDLAMAYRFAGRFDDAIATLGTVLTLSPNYTSARQNLGDIRLQQGRPEEALAEMQKESDASARLEGLAIVYHALGRKAESDAVLAELERDYSKTAAFGIAGVHAFRGDSDAAFEWLERALAANDADIGSLGYNPSFAKLRTDPRWLPLLRRVGVAPEQLERIRFEVGKVGVKRQ